MTTRASRTLPPALVLLLSVPFVSCHVIFGEEVVRCRVDADCSLGCICVHARCVVDHEEEYEEPDDRDEPRVQPACQRDADCGADWQCEAGICEPAERYCSRDWECADGEVCQDWVCRPACATDDDCGSDEICDSGHCEDLAETLACDDIWDCPSGEVCAAGVCEPAESTCESDWDCDPGFVCSNEACVAQLPCAHTGECPEGYACSVDGACYRPADSGRPSECVADFECPAGLRCDSNGHCVDQSGAIPCETEADCPDGGVCVDTACHPPSELECLTRIDCASDEICVDGACVADPSVDPPVPPSDSGGGEALCAPGIPCGGIEYCYDTCFHAECCIVVCNCDLHDDRLRCNLYCD